MMTGVVCPTRVDFVTGLGAGQAWALDRVRHEGLGARRPAHAGHDVALVEPVTT